MSAIIRRDRWGIPHLWGDTVDELAYAQGRAAALDRAWQLEVERWRSEGRLAAQLGPDEVGWDRFARRARLDDTAQRCYAALDDTTRQWIQSYVDGVNAGLAEGAARATEFAATGSAPGRWQPWSPLGVFLVQHILFGTFPSKLWQAHVAATLGPDALGLFAAAEGPGGSGSNAWAWRDEAGVPTIAGDPHRVIELPGIYHQVRLACPSFDVIGFAFPGVPGVPHFGHAGSVAWAVTNAMADYQDLYREQLRRDGEAVFARSATGWEAAAVHHETIEVRGGDPVPVEVIETPRGPIIDVDRRTGEGLSLRTPTRVSSSLGFQALLPLLHANRVDDVVSALGHWVEPVNSLIVADTTGAVHSFVAGRVPIRDERNRWVPVPGWEPDHDWQPGYAPTPSRPVTDVVVNANDRRPGDTAELGLDFAPPHRARRIAELLAMGTAPSAIHMDSAIGAPGLRGLLARVDRSSLSPPAAALAAQLSTWDAFMAAGSTSAGAFAAWRSLLAQRLADHPALRPLAAPTGYDDLFAPWTSAAGRIGYALDPLVTRVGRLGADIEAEAAAALEAVAAGPAPVAWGETHRLAPIRAVADPALDAVIAASCARVTLSGDSDCVLATSSTPGVSDLCWRGPIARYVWDLSDRERGGWVVPFGASGIVGSPHADDQLPRWARGELVPIVTNWRHLLFNDFTVYEEHLSGLGAFRLVMLDPAEHAPLVHSWVTQPRNRFWGMQSHTVDQVREIYEFVDSLPTHHAYLILVDDVPMGIFQTYEPAHDPVGEKYDVRPGDIGMHLLLSPGPRPPKGLVLALGPAFARFLFLDPSKDRIVVEPDVRNAFAVRRLELYGFTFGDEIALGEKQAQLAFHTRTKFESDHAPVA